MVGHLLLCILLFQTIDAAVVPPPVVQPPPRKWMTLNGGRPDIIARGGFSGFYPDSCDIAFDLAHLISLPGTIMYCNLHFTKDNEGFCTAQMNIQNTTFIEQADPNRAKTYNVYGKEITGYFALDYTAPFMYEKVGVRQNIFKRSPDFDNCRITGPYSLLDRPEGEPMRVWLNLENVLFYKQFNISAERYLFNLPKKPEFISSPEIGFLKGIQGRVNKTVTKLIFTVLEKDEVEPTTKKTYGSIIKDELATIKSFASGILVPKEYVWDVDEDRYLLPAASSLVIDAHKAGLAVYASGFANDNYLSYNYSYDPTSEYLQFVDNSQFSVDGVMTEFPTTASEAMTCINRDKKAPRVLNTMVITHNGASGDFPDCTDAAYYKAIEDGADIIDCNAQISKDGVVFCSDRADIQMTTTASDIFERLVNVSEVQSFAGIFSFDLTWAEILSTKPKIKHLWGAGGTPSRNPRNRHSGKFVTIDAFLQIAKQKSVPGVMISIQNSLYLKEKRNLDVVGTVKAALSKAALAKQQRVLIQSNLVEVLNEFRGSGYERVFFMSRTMTSPEDVMKIADSVFVHRDKLLVSEAFFITNATNIIPGLHAKKIRLYVGILRNEFQNLAHNYISDPYVELSTFYKQQVDAFVTEYPLSASTFVRSSCAIKGSEFYIEPLQPKGLTKKGESD